MYTGPLQAVRKGQFLGDEHRLETHGATALTRMPLGRSCCARERVKVQMAPFVAE